MDLYRTIRELYEEKRRLDQVIASLEALRDIDAIHESDGTPKRRGRRSMSPEEKQEVSERMRQYWSDRRKQKGRGEAPNPMLSESRS